jgi:hypothetical protein
MPLFALPTVSEEPVIHLTRWLLIELDVEPLPDIPGPYRFLIGRDLANGCGRASRRVVAQDREKRRAQTHSGRVYVLEGPPSYDDDAWWTFQNTGGRGVRVLDVSADFWPGHTPVNLNGVEAERAQILAALRKAGFTTPG